MPFAQSDFSFLYNEDIARHSMYALHVCMCSYGLRSMCLRVFACVCVIKHFYVIKD